MMTEMRIPKPLYYLVVSLLTQFALAIVALIILLPAGLLGQLPWNMLGFLFVYNILISTLLAVMLTNHSLGNKTAVLKGLGLVLGHLVGLLLGGFVGLKLGGAAWAIGAAAAAYFFFGWIGSRISLAASAFLDREAIPAVARSARSSFQLAPPTSSALFLYGAVIPGFLMAAAVLLKSSGLALIQLVDVLPAARNVLVALSLISILIPWVRRSRVVPRRSGGFSRGSALWLVGLGLSLAPAFYGFLLFLAFDISLAELSLFAVVASMAATAWGVSRAG